MNSRSVPSKAMGPESRGPCQNPADPHTAVTVLQFRDVWRQYTLPSQRVEALKNISVTIDRGEFVALVGRSGCGKTTFLNLAGAMDLPSRGEVLIDGHSTRGLNDRTMTRIRRERVGFVFQFFRLFPTLTALENVELPLQLAGATGVRPKAMELLELVDLADLGSRMPHQLSGGQMQRVAIARALGPSPSVLLADEPMGNLDNDTSAAIMALFRRVNSELGTSIVMATHSVDNAMQAGRILSLEDGRLTEDRQRQPGALAS